MDAEGVSRYAMISQAKGQSIYMHVHLWRADFKSALFALQEALSYKAKLFIMSSREDKQC